MVHSFFLREENFHGEEVSKLDYKVMFLIKALRENVHQKPLCDCISIQIDCHEGKSNKRLFHSIHFTCLSRHPLSHQDFDKHQNNCGNPLRNTILSLEDPFLFVKNLSRAVFLKKIIISKKGGGHRIIP